VLVGPLPAKEPGASPPLVAFFRIQWLALLSQLNLEDVPAEPRAMLLAAYGLIAAGAIALVLFRREPGRRGVKAGAPLVGGALWWVAGIAPLALVVVGWNNWRSTLPGVWLGLSVIGFLGLVQPWLAAAFVLVRAIALLACPVAPYQVTYDLPH